MIKEKQNLESQYKEKISENNQLNKELNIEKNNLQEARKIIFNYENEKKENNIKKKELKENKEQLISNRYK